MRTSRRTILVVLLALSMLTPALWVRSPSRDHVALAAPSGTTVQDWQTSQAGDRLTAKANLSFAADEGSTLPTIQMTPTRYYQAMDGFGGAFNEAGWQVLNSLSSSARTAVLAEMFNSTTGAGFSLARTPMGLNDFSLSQYTYDDLGSGTDFGMNQFSVNHDLQYLIPYIQAAKAQGNFRLFASPWSAPAWMKTNNSLVNGGSVIPPSTDPRYYQAYALYFQKYVQAYAQNNIPIDFVSVQNEPGYAAPFGSTAWTPAQMADFVANYLGPQFQQNNVGARIRVFEWNRDQWQFPKQILDNPATAPYVAGVDWHNYECLSYCQPDNLDLFNASHPGYSTWMGEYTTINTTPIQSYLDSEKWGNIIMTDLSHGEGGWVFWNMVLNQNGGPYAPASGAQDSLVEVDTSTSPATVYYLPKFWYLAQFSKFVRPGAYRIGADGGQANDGLSSLGFKNTDGSEVLVVMNTNNANTQIKVREDGNIFEPTLAAHSINTFKWNAPVNTYHIIAGSTGSWNSIASDPFTADAFYSGGMAPVNTTPPIANTADDPLYQSERYGSNFSYSFPVPNGRYQVTLKFSENYWNCSGCRTFNVSSEGSQVLSSFDIYAAAGGARYTAVDRTFTTNVTDGNLDLQFTGVVDNAKVDAIAITPLPPDGSPYKSTLSAGVPAGYTLSSGIAPGYVFAQDYNTGGEGYAYHFGYQGGTDTSYRSDAINLETCSNDSHCGDDLSYLSSGDYVNYTINVLVGGNYDLQARVASPNTGGQFSVNVDGAPLAGTQNVPNTGGYQAWTTVPLYGLNLSKGIHTFRFHVVTGGFNLHYLFFKKVHRLDTTPSIDAVWYAGGGEGEGYHDTTPGNYFTSPYPGFYRSEDVDIEISSEHSYDIGQTANGEWLRYDIYSPSARTYTLTFRVASNYSPGGQVRVDLDSVGSTIGATLTVPNTGGFETWQDLSETVNLPAGTHALFVYIVQGGFNFDRLTLN